MKIVIMGTGPFAVPCCQALLDHGHDIPMVVVRPASAGDKKADGSPVKAWAMAAHLPVIEPTSINAPDAIESLRSIHADLFFVCDYGQILSSQCLGITRLGGINLHGSLLPRHRGAAPVQWTLLAGDLTAGVSVIHMTPGLDAGPVLTSRSVQVDRDENAAELEGRLAALGAPATLEAIEQLSAWDGQSLIGQLQDRSLATKAPRLSRADGRLDFSMPSIELERRVRGFQPWPGAYADLVYSDSKRISLHLRAARAIVASDDATESQASGAARLVSAEELGQSGDEWLAPWDKLLAVRTGDGWLVASQVQPAGKRTMPAADFLRGHPLTAHARFQ